VVGGYRTLVKAIDMQTVGLGGDSEIEVNFEGHIILRANRVVPISLMGARWPSLIETLKASLSAGVGMRRASRYLVRPEGSEQEGSVGDLSKPDLELLASVDKEPQPYSDLVFRASQRGGIARLIDRGLVQIVGFTPSDAAHVLGLQSQWSREAAVAACMLIGRANELISYNENEAEAECRGFAESVFSAVVAKSSHLIIERLCGQRLDATDSLIAAVTTGNHRVAELGVALSSEIPMVAVGGPAAVFYPEVGRRLGVKAVIPNDSAVANAIGAAIGLVKARAVVEITKREDGAFNVHHEGEPFVTRSPHEALAKAQEIAEAEAHSHSVAMGGRDIQVSIEVERILVPGRDGDDALVAATVIGESTSAPQLDPS
jgi:N-methylhydantoinase A/oxoprolinase/acetone carboxylase beta subunit